MTNPLNTDAVKSEERAAFEAACQKLASMPEEAHEKLFGNDDLDTWWALWKEARASSTITSPKAVNSGQTEREAWDVALDALDDYQRNWDTGLPAEYASGERIAMECAVEAVREALNEARAASPAPASPSGEDAAEQADAPVAAMPKGYAVKRVEGHGWVIDPPSGSRWIAYEGTPAGDLMQALAALPRASEQADEAVTSARYIVIGYGESDHPQAAFVNERDALLDAVLGMMFMHPSDADEEIRESYRADLADDDEWSHDGIWRTEFEIGGIVIYDLGYGTAEDATTKEPK